MFVFVPAVASGAGLAVSGAAGAGLCVPTRQVAAEMNRSDS
jgi:hypothetical protein